MEAAVSNQLISLTSREENRFWRQTNFMFNIQVSNQLISLTSREIKAGKQALTVSAQIVSNQLISLTSRELPNGEKRTQLEWVVTRFQSINFPNE
jgi:hypothetical protein